MSDIGERVVVVQRPHALFAEHGTMPAEVELPDVLIEIKGGGAAAPER